MAGLLGFGFWRPWRESRMESWMNAMRAEGEKFTVAELSSDDAVSSEELARSIQAASFRIRLIIAQRPVLESPPLRSPLPGMRRIAWSDPYLVTVDGWNISWETAERERLTQENLFQQLHESLRSPNALVNDPARVQAWRMRTGDLSARRVVGQALGNAILSELNQGNLEAAHRHLLTFASLVQLHGKEYSYGNQMVRIALTGLGASLAWEAMQAPGWTDDQLSTLQAAWSSRPLISEMIKTLELERAFGLQYFEQAGRWETPLAFPAAAGGTHAALRKLEPWVILPVYKTIWHQTDVWFFLNYMQEVLEALRELDRERSWKAVWPRLSAEFQDHALKGSGLGRYRFPLTTSIVPNFWKVFLNMVEHLTEQEMAMAALLIRRHALRFGRLPSGLEALEPGLATERPVDYWDGQPIRYRPRPGGTFLLYACGPNLIDDGGDPDADQVWPQGVSSDKEFESRKN